jgi:aminopeptidase N
MARLFETGSDNPHRSAYSSYLSEAKNNSENALVTHADHYTTNRAYGVAAYSKGEVLLTQLGYVIGNDVRDNALLSYFDQWKFKHPDAKSFKRVMERESGLELDWYFEYFVNSTHTIDYGVKEISGGNTSTSVVLERIGLMPMPIDLEIETTDGNVMMINIPLEMMRGAKKQDENLKFVVEKDWPWTNPTYELKLDIPIDQILKITIDPKSEMADLNRANNSIEIKEGMRYMMQN